MLCLFQWLGTQQRLLELLAHAYRACWMHFSSIPISLPSFSEGKWWQYKWKTGIQRFVSFCSWFFFCPFLKVVCDWFTAVHFLTLQWKMIYILARADRKKKILHTRITIKHFCSFTIFPPVLEGHWHQVSI